MWAHRFGAIHTVRVQACIAFKMPCLLFCGGKSDVESTAII